MNTILLDLDHIDSLIGSNNLPKASVLTIGNFDGVHLGHQAMLRQLKTTAQKHNLATMVMIFEPQPREYFAKLKGDPQSAPARLTSQYEKLALLTQFGVDTVVIAQFNETFRSLSATEFADILTHKLNVTALVLGDDFKFGHDRTGDSEFLRQYGLPVTNLQTITDSQSDGLNTDALNKETKNIQDYQNNNVNKTSTDAHPLEVNRISSTRIRELLYHGYLDTANQLLNRVYSMIGKVVGGDKIGRTLDFPTANIELNRLRPALHGVYGVDVVVLDDTGAVVTDAFDNIAKPNQVGIKGLRPHSLFGTANIGIRPSVDKPNDWRLEVFFPEFSGDLYGKTLEVRFLYYLHEELKYDGLDALKAGIKQDVIDLIAWRKSVQPQI